MTGVYKNDVVSHCTRNRRGVLEGSSLSVIGGVWVPPGPGVPNRVVRVGVGHATAKFPYKSMGYRCFYRAAQQMGTRITTYMCYADPL